MGKLKKLMEVEGIENFNALEFELSDYGDCPCICMNKDCNCVEYYEPDQDIGWCPECETNSMKSAFVLMGLI